MKCCSLYIARVQRKNMDTTLQAHQLQRNNRSKHNNSKTKKTTQLLFTEKNTLFEDPALKQKSRNTQIYTRIVKIKITMKILFSE